MEENKLNHPQPHWHIEPTIMFNDKEIDKEVKETFDELLNETDFFHYMNESEKNVVKYLIMRNFILQCLLNGMRIPLYVIFLLQKKISRNGLIKV